MRRRLRIILIAFAAALVALVFVLPIIQADRCADVGGTYDRATLRCALISSPVGEDTKP